MCTMCYTYVNKKEFLKRSQKLQIPLFFIANGGFQQQQKLDDRLLLTVFSQFSLLYTTTL